MSPILERRRTIYAVAFHSPAARDSTRGACVVGGLFSCCGHRSYRSSLLWRIDAEGLVKNRDDKKEKERERERERSEAFLHIFPSIDGDRERGRPGGEMAQVCEL